MNINIYLTSTSNIKKEAISQLYPTANIISIKSKIVLPEQPMGIHEAVYCAKARIPKNIHTNEVVVSIENYIEKDPVPMDMVCIIIKHATGKINCYYGGKRFINHPEYNDYDRSHHGTYGEYISSIHKELDPKNWVGDRVDQIMEVFNKISDPYHITSVNIGAYLNYTPDFPKPGVLFKDMSPLFNKCNITPFLAACCSALSRDYINIKHVIGLESRGFHIGALIANQFQASFHMARKVGKLPPPTIMVRYSTEYSTVAMEMPDIPLTPGAVLIVDDLIATGGSITAVAQIVKQLTQESTHISCFAPLYVESLEQKAKAKLEENSITWVKF